MTEKTWRDNPNIWATAIDSAPPTLDVERLALALEVALNRTSPAGRYDLLAQSIAAEYARLAQDRSPEDAA